MSLRILPAIDLLDGKAVRLRAGRKDDVTVYRERPEELVGELAAAGAERIHVVDLDGAFAGVRRHADVIARMCAAAPVPIQVGGGIRDEQAIDAYLDAGVQFVIIGTKAVQEPHFINDLCLEYPGHIIVGLDAKDGRVAVNGWSKLSKHNVIDLAQVFERYGVEAIVYTDISRDGMMQGVNVDTTVRLAQAIGIPVIASGGVSTLDDVRALCAVEQEGIMGAIIGRALYEGDIDLAAAQQLADAAENG